MELFTLGPGHYTETDVREGARIFSGVRAVLVDASGALTRVPSLQELTPQQQLAAIGELVHQGYSYKGMLVPRLHDSGSTGYLGHSGNLDPEHAIDIILARESCAPHVVQRALVHFCSPQPPPALVRSVADQFRRSKYDIATLMRTIFTSDDFTMTSAYRSLVRSPVDYTVAAMRALGRPALAAAAVRSGVTMGQVLYDPPNVGGWPSNAGMDRLVELAGPAQFRGRGHHPAAGAAEPGGGAAAPARRGGGVRHERRPPRRRRRRRPVVGAFGEPGVSPQVRTAW